MELALAKVRRLSSLATVCRGFLRGISGLAMWRAGMGWHVAEMKNVFDHDCQAPTNWLTTDPR